MGPDDESEGVPVWGAYFFFVCPNLLGHLCSGEARKGTDLHTNCKVFSKDFSKKNSKNSGGRCEVDYLLATREGRLWG